ncbi:MAG: apolipoprotein N-acyltransferase [Streptosporangiaceae bacterium]
MRLTGASGLPGTRGGPRRGAAPAAASGPAASGPAASAAGTSGSAAPGSAAPGSAAPGPAAGQHLAGAQAPAAGSDPAGPGGLRLGWALLTALAGGGALAAAFPPAGVWPLAVAGPALLAAALWRRSVPGSLLTGLVFGVAFFFPLLSWLVNVAWYVWVTLAVIEAVMFAVLALGQRLLLRLRRWPAAVAGWWVSVEALRDRWPVGGFPWGRLAMSQASAPTARWAAVGGPPLLTFLLGLAGGCLAWLLLGRPGLAGEGLRHALRTRARPALAFAAAAGLALAGGLLPVDAAGPGDHTATVATVQGNVPHARNLPDQLRATTVTQNHAAATLRLAREVANGSRPPPQVVIWPENSTDLDPRFDPLIYATIAQAVAAIGRPVLVGAVLQDPLRNVGQLWLPHRGPVAIYVKRQLVPFGEYIPLRGFLSHFTSLPSLQPVNFTPGHRAVVFRLGRIRLGDIICYEVGFDPLVRSEVRAGANLLVVQSNDADFELDGQLGETQQQIAMARIDAISTNRAVVYASTTGESAIIAPDGTVIAHSDIWRRALLDARVPLRAQLTLADRAGAWPELTLVALTLAALAWAAGIAWIRRRRPRR